MFDFKTLSILTPAGRARLRLAKQLAAQPAPRAPAPAPKKATAPPAPAPKPIAPRTPTAEERAEERKADRKRREREFEQMMAFVKNPSASPFAHLANYRAPEIELFNVEPFVAGHGSDAAQFETHVPDPAAFAKEVLRCGELARGIGPQRAEPTGLAAQVIATGKKRRSLSVVEPELPHDPIARAIVLAGMRRRGEIE
jgi:hypothetical protein